MTNVVSSGKSWAKELIHYYSEGYSDAEVAAELKITLREYYRQAQENSTFAQLVEYGRTLSLAYWEGLARKNVTNRNFNTSLYNFYMKNRHGWADKVESTTNLADIQNADLDTLREQTKEQVSKFLDTHLPEISDAKKLLQASRDRVN